jgi:hypothetical protein
MRSGERRGYEEWNVIESQQVQEWMAMGEAKGEVKGEIKLLLRALTALSPTGVPTDLEDKIRTITSEEQVQAWFDLALKSSSLEAFRQATKL